MPLSEWLIIIDLLIKYEFEEVFFLIFIVLHISPFFVVLYLAKITFGFTFSPNLVAIIGMILALVIFQHL